MATRGRIKGWKSPETVAKMSSEEREAYEAMIAKAKAEREAEKKAELAAKGIDPETYEKEKTEKIAQREEKKINLQNLINSQLEYQNTHIMSQEEDEEDGKGKPWYQESENVGDYKETNINHLSGEGYCIIETNEDFWIRKIAEMIEKTPDKVIVLSNWCRGDLLRVKVPYSAMKKIKTQSRILSEEQRQRMSELGKSMSKKRGRPRKNNIENEVKENNNEPTGQGNPNVPGSDNSDISTSADRNVDDVINTDTLKPIEESDEDFENTPMNVHRNYTQEEPDIKEEPQNNEDDDIAYCDTADQDDYEKNLDDDDYDEFEI